MRAGIIISVVITLTLLIGGFFTYRALYPHESLKNSEAVRDFAGTDGTQLGTYTDLAGAPLDLNQFAGTVRVVNIWATWSPASAADLELITEVVHETGAPVTQLAVNRAEPAAKVQAYVAHYALKDQFTFVLDPSDTFYKTVGGFAMPETIIYDTAGTKVLHHRGEITKEVLTAALKTAVTAE